MTCYQTRLDSKSRFLELSTRCVIYFEEKVKYPFKSGQKLKLDWRFFLKC